MFPSRTGRWAFSRGPTRLAFGISLLVIGLASLIGASAASAGTLVEFPNLDGHTPANLSGYLARPDAHLSAELGGTLKYGAPFPAVVVLHGCNGMFGNSAVIADRLSSWGYVSLVVDSFGPRGFGILNRCGRGMPDQVFDAYAALRYLSQLDFVDPALVAVFGQSMGGETLEGGAAVSCSAGSRQPRCRNPELTWEPFSNNLLATGRSWRTKPLPRFPGLRLHRSVEVDAAGSRIEALEG